MPSTRPCRECGALIELKIARDLTRKFYCSRSCRGLYLGRGRDMRPLWEKAQTPEANAKKGRPGPSSPAWKPIGTRSLSAHGYVKVKVAAGKWLYEHRIVAKAGAQQVTHHKNRVKTDNSPSNLECMTNEEHAVLHAKEDRHA